MPAKVEKVNFGQISPPPTSTTKCRMLNTFIEQILTFLLENIKQSRNGKIIFCSIPGLQYIQMNTNMLSVTDVCKNLLCLLCKIFSHEVIKGSALSAKDKSHTLAVLPTTGYPTWPEETLGMVSPPPLRTTPQPQLLVQAVPWVGLTMASLDVSSLRQRWPDSVGLKLLNIVKNRYAHLLRLHLNFE